MKATHIATYGLIGPISGRRVGTHFIYTCEQAHKARAELFFRWRNEECRSRYREWISERAKSLNTSSEKDA